MVRAWFDGLDLAPTTKRKRLGFVHQILRAHGNESRYKPPKSERHTRRPLTPQEVAKLRAEILSLPNEKRIGVLLCLECGLRRSEACGLRHEDREGDGIRIRRTVVRVTGEVRVRQKGKTASSHAWIPLPPSLVGEIGRGSGYVLGGKTPMYPDVLTNAVRRVCEVAGLRVPHAGPHALRRTYGMTLLEAGVDVVTAAELMRHDPKMLLDEYARSREDLKADAVQRAFGTKTAPKTAPGELPA
jgi:integrase